MKALCEGKKTTTQLELWIHALCRYGCYVSKAIFSAHQQNTLLKEWETPFNQSIATYCLKFGDQKN